MMKHAVTFSFVFLLMLIILSSPAFPQVQTRLRIIQASNVGSTIDPSLKDLRDQLAPSFNFTSYRLLRDERLSLSSNKPAEISAHPNIALEITLVKQRKNNAEFRVRIRREGTEILNTQVRLSPGRTVLIGGPKHGEGIAILAITARF